MQSYQRSWAAYNKGLYHEEIIGYENFASDEVFHKEWDMERVVQRAKTIFKLKNGTVTAANSCGIHDGAAAVVVMGEDLAAELDMQAVLLFRDSEVCGIHPKYPGISPVPAIAKLLARYQLTMEDIDLIEIKEVFAAKIIACGQEL